MDINISKIEYFAELITENGEIYPLDDSLLSLMWEEQENTLSTRASLSLVFNKKLSSLIKIGCIIRLYYKYSGTKKLLFEGTIWDCQFDSSGGQKSLDLSAYDPLIRLQQSKDFKYFSKGLTTKDIIQNICTDWGIPLSYKWAKSIIHEKKVFSGNSISDMIIQTLNEVKQETGDKYVVLFRDNKLEITGYGNQNQIYKFSSQNVLSENMKISIDNLVTRVKIIGKADDDGRSPVEAVIDGNLKFGVLQEIIRRDSDSDLGKASKDAKNVLSERGKPQEDITVIAPDLPFLRRADAIELDTENFSGVFFITGISHNAEKKQMTMTLLRQENLVKSENSDSSVSSDFQKGDSVILNGAVYADSYGNGKGWTFTNYKGKITITAPLSRPCPYHIDHIGWVYKSSITK